MIQMAATLILINLSVLIGIGLIRQSNPFEIWVLCLLLVCNVIVIGASAVLTHDDWVNALTAFATNFLPLVFVASGVALVLMLMSAKPR